MPVAFLAVDWGTTNRRAYRIEDGTVVATERDDRGALAVAPGGFAKEAAAIREQLGALPLVCAGMVGSNIGWTEVPYVEVPADLEAVARGTVRVADDIWIVPGVATRADMRPDVMRGEETQLLGAAVAELVPANALLCQPGTHCKWATLTERRIVDFTTSMTGEMFALLKAHGLLARQLGRPVDVGAPFLEGVAEGRRGDLTASLFGIRAAGLLGRRDDANAAAFASGLLIGSDLAVRLVIHSDPVIHIVADPAMGQLYAAAIRTHGREVHIVDSHAAFIAGATRLWSLLG